MKALGLLCVLAWRNLWRHGHRTLLTAATVSLGLALLLISLGLGSGGDRQMLDSAVQMGGAHVAVEAPGYEATRSLDRTVPVERIPALASALAGHGFGATAVLPRVFASGLASSADGSSGVSIIGIDPVAEAPFSAIDDHIVAGTFFGGSATNVAVVGFGVARKLALKPGAKFVLMAQSGGSGDIESMLVRVAGVTRSNAEEIDQSAVFLPLATAQALTGLAGRVHQVAVVLDDVDGTHRAAALLRANTGSEFDVLTWEQLMPSQRDLLRLNFAGRILVDLAFLLIIAFLVLNTLLMSVVERRREFALLDALGLTPVRRFVLVLLEGTWIAALSVTIGAAAGYAGHLYFKHYGLPLRRWFSGAMSAAGSSMDPVLYSALPTSQLVVTTALVFLLTVVLALFPSWKAATDADARFLR